jgi:hypothetical protein
LFVGGYDHPPNVDAARWLANDIMPLVWRAVPDAKLILAGSRPPAELLALAGPLVEVPGWVPDLAPFYARARLSLNPLRFGAGVKGKIVASLQAGLPVVTTTIGNEGLSLEPDAEVLIGDSAEDLAGHAVRLLQDPVQCAGLANAGTSKVRRQFGEDVMRRSLLAALARDLCPVCGRMAAAERPVRTCDACAAGELERALAEAAIRTCRALGRSSLREAAPLLGQASVPPGSLARMLGRDNDAAGLDLLITLADPDPDPAGPDLGRVRPGGRMVAPLFDTGRLHAAGWEIRMHEAGPTVIEATRPIATA